MRSFSMLLASLLVGFCLTTVPGCGGSEPEVVMGTPEEEEAYAAEVYGAEEEMEGEEE